MKEKTYFKRKSVIVAIIVLIFTCALGGCSQKPNPAIGEEAAGENVIITETGEVLEQEVQETKESAAEPNQTPEIVVFEGPLEEPKQEQVITEHDDASVTDPGALQVVFLGDSILDTNRDETGIAYNVGVTCEANVYNLSVGGTSASLESGEPQEYSKWTSRSLVGVTLMLAEKVNTAPIKGSRAEENMQKMDVSNTDYFVVEYGLNDFFRGVPLSNQENGYDLTTYVGALRVAVSNLQGLAPDATIILCSPNYAQFYHEDVFIGDGNSLNNGQGTLFDYKGICEYVSNEKNTLFMDAYLDLGINGYTADDYLEDGVHLTAEGRKLYADYLSKIILNYEETKNN